MKSWKRNVDCSMSVFERIDEISKITVLVKFLYYLTKPFEDLHYFLVSVSYCILNIRTNWCVLPMIWLLYKCVPRWGYRCRKINCGHTRLDLVPLDSYHSSQGKNNTWGKPPSQCHDCYVHLPVTVLLQTKRPNDAIHLFHLYKHRSVLADSVAPVHLLSVSSKSIFFLPRHGLIPSRKRLSPRLSRLLFLYVHRE